MNINNIISIIGADETLKLCERCGGSTIYIPEIPDSNSRLALALGFSSTKKLCDTIPKTVIYIPSKSSIINKSRRSAIVFEIKLGRNSSDCAIHHGVSTQYVNHLKRIHHVGTKKHI